jgi:hypothetical protein
LIPHRPEVANRSGFHLINGFAGFRTKSAWSRRPACVLSSATEATSVIRCWRRGQFCKRDTETACLPLVLFFLSSGCFFFYPTSVSMGRRATSFRMMGPGLSGHTGHGFRKCMPVSVRLAFLTLEGLCRVMETGKMGVSVFFFAHMTATTCYNGSGQTTNHKGSGSHFS